VSAFDTYLDYVRPFKGSSRFHTWCAISAFSAVLERRVWLNHSDLGNIYPNQYIIICGGAGLGKTTASKLATGLIKEYNKSLGPSNGGIKFGPDKMTPAALLKRFSESVKTFRLNDRPPLQQSALYLHSTELATMLRDIGGGTLSDDLLKLYDNDDCFEKETVGGGVMKIPYPCLNFLGDTTPAFLSAYLPAEASGTGLTARVIFAVEMGEVQMDEELPAGDKVLRMRLIQHIKRMHGMVGEMKFDPSAKALWSSTFKEIRKLTHKFPDGSFMRNFYARKQDHLRKISMTLSACRDNSMLIQPEDLEVALALLSDVEPFMDKIFGVRDISKTNDAPKRIFDCIPFAPSEIEEADLINAVFRGGMAGQIDSFEAMVELMVRGRMVSQRRDETGKKFYSKISYLT